jgi:hypothetical protein
MRSGIHHLVGLSVILGVAGVTSVVSFVATTPYAYAEHETRTSTLQDSGTNLWIIGLTIGLAVVGLILFAAVMLAWERRDAAAGGSEASAAARRDPKS